MSVPKGESTMSMEGFIQGCIKEWGLDPEKGENHRSFIEQLMEYAQDIATDCLEELPENDLVRLPGEPVLAIRTLLDQELKAILNKKNFIEVIDNIQKDNPNAKIEIPPFASDVDGHAYTLREGYSTLDIDSNDFDPFLRFGTRITPSLEWVLNCSGKSEKMWEVAVKAVVAAHACTYSKCVHCKKRNSIFWNRYHRKRLEFCPWKKLVCTSCGSVYDIVLQNKNSAKACTDFQGNCWGSYHAVKRGLKPGAEIYVALLSGDVSRRGYWKVRCGAVESVSPLLKPWSFCLSDMVSVYTRCTIPNAHDWFEVTCFDPKNNALETLINDSLCSISMDSIHPLKPNTDQAAALSRMRQSDFLAFILLKEIDASQNLYSSLPGVDHFNALCSAKNMAYLVERMVAHRQQLKEQGTSCFVDIGYHYTEPANLVSIRSEGLLNREDRMHSSVTIHKYQDGCYSIYTANDPTTTSEYGRVGLLVLRLRLRCDMRLKGYVVLPESSQCVPIVRFPTQMVVHNKNLLRFLYRLHTQMQNLLDKHLNEGRKTEILWCPNWHLVISAAQTYHFTKRSRTTSMESQFRDPNIGYSPSSDQRSECSISLPDGEKIKIKKFDRVTYQAPEATSQTKLTHGIYRKLQPLEKDSPCQICGQELLGPHLSGLHFCVHVFHFECLANDLMRKKECPICKKRATDGWIAAPSGSMTIIHNPQEACLEFGMSGSFAIEYSIPPGVLKEHHDHPGLPYAGMKIETFVPDTFEGFKLLKRLQFAFRNGMTFRARKLGTAEHICEVCLTEIPHIISARHGVVSDGHPIQEYFMNCNKTLTSFGVPSPAKLLEDGSMISGAIADFV